MFQWNGCRITLQQIWLLVSFLSFRNKFSRKEFLLLDIGGICKYVLEYINIYLRQISLRFACESTQIKAGWLNYPLHVFLCYSDLWKHVTHVSIGGSPLLGCPAWLSLLCVLEAACIFSTYSSRLCHALCFTLLIVLVFGERTDLFYS